MLTIITIAFPSLVGALLVILRVYRTGYYTFIFLLWNLFLAWIPLLFAIFADSMFYKNQKVTISLILVSLIWLLFYPNAPYILTDLIHLKVSQLMPVWFDLALILSFAWTGLFIGYISLYIMQGIVARVFNKVWGWIFVVLVTALSSFGVYLGRVLRWNSWDVVANPKGLLYDAAIPFLNPLSNKWSILFTGVFFVISLYIYLSFYFSAKISNQHLD